MTRPMTPYMIEKHRTPGKLEVRKVEQPGQKGGGNKYQLIAASPHCPSMIQVVAEVNGPWKPENYAANARRLVACWNMIENIKEKKRGLSPVASAEHEDLTAALDALRHCRNRISSDPTFGACPLGLDELIALLEQKWRMK